MKKTGEDVLNRAVDLYTRGCYHAIREPQTADDIEMHDALASELEVGRDPIGIVRTERRRDAPKVGDSISFSMASASTDPGWAHRVACGALDGIKSQTLDPDDFVALMGTPVVAFEVEGQTGYLDVSNASPYKDQHEVVFSGEYIVAGVEVESIDTGIRTGRMLDRRVDVREYAKKRGLSVEVFESKRGKKMVRVGEPGDDDYVVAEDGKTLSDGFDFETIRTLVHHVRLDRD